MLPGIGLGEGARLAFGADSGPIESTDSFSTGFETGAFGNKGTSSITMISLVLGSLLIMGLVVWAISR